MTAFPELIWELRNAGTSRNQEGVTHSATAAWHHPCDTALGKGGWIQTPRVIWAPLEDTRKPQINLQLMTISCSKRWWQQNSTGKQSLAGSPHQCALLLPPTALNPCRTGQGRETQQSKQMPGQQLLPSGRCAVMEPPLNSGETQALETSQPGKVGMQLPLGWKNWKEMVQGKSETV